MRLFSIVTSLLDEETVAKIERARAERKRRRSEANLRRETAERRAKEAAARPDDPLPSPSPGLMASSGTQAVWACVEEDDHDPLPGEERWIIHTHRSEENLRSCPCWGQAMIVEFSSRVPQSGDFVGIVGGNPGIAIAYLIDE